MDSKIEEIIQSEHLKWNKEMREMIDEMWIRKEKDKTGHDVGWNSALAELEGRLKLLKQMEDNL